MNNKELTEEEVWVREELAKLYPQLVINCQKTLGAAYNKHGGDLLAVCVEFFLNKPIATQVRAFKEGKAENFITFMMGMQSKSGSSKFYNEYRRFNEGIRDLYDNYDYDYLLEVSKGPEPFEDEVSELMQCINQQMDDLNPYEKMLIQERVIKGSRFVEIADTYDINYTSLSSELKKVLKKIKNKCSHLR